MKLVRIVVLSTVVFAVFLAGDASSKAQAIPSASKSAEISAFGGYMPSRMDYGPHSLKGFAGGVDFTVFPRFPVAPSIEVRGTYGSNLDATEKTIMVGIRVQRDWRDRYHFYVDGLIGLGQITFHPDPYPDYSADQSKALAFGGGINIDVSHHFAAKFDIQEQHWNLGENEFSGPNTNFTLHPTQALVGVTYTIPFRVLKRHSDFR
jgi:hypothetical protein